MVHEGHSKLFFRCWWLFVSHCLSIWSHTAMIMLKSRLWRGRSWLLVLHLVLFVCFLSMMGLLHWLCGWDQCHAEKRSRCQSHAFQMVLYGGWKSDSTFPSSFRQDHRHHRPQNIKKWWWLKTFAQHYKSEIAPIVFQWCFPTLTSWWKMCTDEHRGNLKKDVLIYFY